MEGKTVGADTQTSALSDTSLDHSSYKGKVSMKCTRCRVEALVFVSVAASGKHLYQCQNCMKIVELDPDNMDSPSGD